MSGRDRKMAKVWTPNRGDERSFDTEELNGPQIGKIKSISSAGVKVTFDSYLDAQLQFGPYPYAGLGLTAANTGDTVAGGTNHHHTVSLPAPVVGNHCLVIFTAEPGSTHGVVVAWWA